MHAWLTQGRPHERLSQAHEGAPDRRRGPRLRRYGRLRLPGRELDDVPISKAVAASCAIPGLYRPVRINGVDYIDGGVRKTAHISLALRERCGLTICINPIVPVRFHPDDASGRGAGATAAPRPPDDPRPGLPRHAPLAAEVRPRRATAARTPRPTSSSSSRARRTSRATCATSCARRAAIRIAEYAYRSTMETLDADFKRLQRVFARHGLILRPACARDRVGGSTTRNAHTRRFRRGSRPPSPRSRPTSTGWRRRAAADVSASAEPPPATRP